VHQVFVLLTCCAALDVFCDPGSGVGPEVFLVDGSNGFVPSGMAIDGSFVPYVH
jgi:hypothetical protein